MKQTVLARLSRVTSGGSLIDEIDGLRFVAILGVVLVHLQELFVLRYPYTLENDMVSTLVRPIIGAGSFGVQLFFAISGMILSLPFAAHFLQSQPRVPLGRYYLRRLTRLEPPFIIAVLVSFVGAQLLFGSKGCSGLNVLAALGYSHTIFYGAPAAFMPQMWSLEVEVQYYLLAPLLALVFTIQHKYWRRAVIVAIGLLPILFDSWMRTLPVSIMVRYLQYFMVGFLLADVYLVDWKSKATQSTKWDIIGIVAWLGLGLGLVFFKEHERFFSGLAILMAYMAAFKGPWLNRLFRNRWMCVTGGMCYTIYLYHFIFIEAMGNYFFHEYWGTNLWACLVLVGVPILLVMAVACALLFVLVEKPCMYRNWPRQLMNWIKIKLAISARTSN